MLKFSLGGILKATDGKLISQTAPADYFCGVTTDSQRVKPHDLFVALKGEKFDGHDFIQEALTQGATGVLVHDEKKVTTILDRKNVAVIQVADTLKALGDLAYDWRMRCSALVIAVTGSSGKTTVKEMMAQIIGQKKNLLKTEGNLNNRIGLPQTIFKMTKKHEVVILEMGSNTRGEIKRLTQIASPDIGVITNVGPAHLAGFGSMEVVRDEKCDLFLNMSPFGTAVINLDDEAIVNGSEKWNGKRVTFSMGTASDVTVTQIERFGIRGVTFQLVIGSTMRKVDMKIVGMHHVYNAMAAAATAWAAGIDLDTIAEGLSAFRPFSGRMEIIKLRNGAYVIDDSYNANPASARESLLTLKDLKANHRGYVFLGDMLELGPQAEEMHRKIGMLAGTIDIAALFLQGDFSPITAAGAIEGGLSPDRIFFLPREDEAIAYLKKHLKKGIGYWLKDRGG